jgi:uncharacterized protein YecE (DUF72 family)
VGDIRVGTSSWADRELISSGWYPREANTPAGRLAYYTEHFNLVGVDTTRYAIPSVDTTTAWVERTPAGFTFDVTAFGVLTGHATAVDKLPRDLRPADGPDRVRRKDLSTETWAELWRRFHEAIEPLAAAGRLGAVLLQFPAWFQRGDAARNRVLATIRECRPHRIAVELPHPSWFEPEHALPTLQFLQAHDASVVCVDESYLNGPIVVTTADPAVVCLRRTHTDAALARWAERLRLLAPDADLLHVLVDTPGGQSANTAARLAELVSRGRRAPATASVSGRAR